MPGRRPQSTTRTSKSNRLNRQNMDIAENPGVISILLTHRSCEDRSAPDLNILPQQTITYSRSQLFAIRRLSRCVPSHQVLH